MIHRNGRKRDGKITRLLANPGSCGKLKMNGR